jgi:hypothetical protein
LNSVCQFSKIGSSWKTESSLALFTVYDQLYMWYRLNTCLTRCIFFSARNIASFFCIIIIGYYRSKLFESHLGFMSCYYYYFFFLPLPYLILSCLSPPTLLSCPGLWRWVRGTRFWVFCRLIAPTVIQIVLQGPDGKVDIRSI